MYKITIQTLTGSEHTIYVPGNDEYIVTSAVLSLSVGSAGEFNFTIPLGNPRYNEIVDHSIVTVYEDNAEIWRGDIQDIKQNFDKSLNVYCLEDMAWLGESAVAMTAITDQTYGQRFSAAIASYNANQVAKRQFAVGMLTSITTTNMCTWQPQYEEDLLSCLRNYIADDGKVRIRREYNGGTLTRYVDIVKLSDYGQQADQKIEFGSNLLDFVKEMDNTNFLNVIYPYGKETETPLYGDIMQRVVGTPIQNDVSIAAFGRRERSVIFETDSLARLNSLAQSYLNRYSQPIVKLEVKAVDLGNIEIVNRIHLGDSVRIIASTFGIDQWSYATKQELNLLDIADNQITLADAVRVQSLTSQVIEQAQEIKDAQTPASVLDEAKRNAWAIFEGDNGGIVTFEVNGSEQIIGIHIANNLDIDQATKAWGWNINGLVYLHRTYPTDDWQVGIAMTMNGEIVADYITTGTLTADIIKTGTLNAALANIINLNASNITTGYLRADRIKGGILLLGGYNNVDGRLLIMEGDEEVTAEYTVSPNSGILFSLDEGNAGDVYVDVTYYEGWTGDSVGEVRKDGVFVCALVPGENHVFSYLPGSSFDFTVGALFYTITFKVIYRRATASLSKDGLVASYINALGGKIGSLSLEDGELYSIGDIPLYEAQYTTPVGSGYYSQDIFLFRPSKLGVIDSTFNLELDYDIYDNLSGNYDYELSHLNGSSWSIVESGNLETTVGLHSLILNTDFNNTDSSYWNLNVYVDGQATEISIDIKVLIPDTRKVSLSNNGYFGEFTGAHKGTADFSFAKLGNIVLSRNEITTDYSEIESTDHPLINIKESDSKYIKITRMSMRLQNGSNTHCLFRGEADLVAYRHGSPFSIAWSGSDRRIKEEIEPLDLDLSKNLIDATETVKFKYKSNEGKHYGVIAQDVREVLDNLGETDVKLEHSMGFAEGESEIEDPRTVDYHEFIPHLINYVKDLRAEIEALKNIINTLKEDK